MVRATRPRKHEEGDIQEAFFHWLALSYPHINEVTFAIPNGGKRSLREAVRLKRQGVKAGIPDIFMSVPSGLYHGLYIEFKTQKGRCTKLQEEKIYKLIKRGYVVEVARSWIEAKNYVEAYLKGVI